MLKRLAAKRGVLLLGAVLAGSGLTLAALAITGVILDSPDDEDEPPAATARSATEPPRSFNAPSAEPTTSPYRRGTSSRLSSYNDALCYYYPDSCEDDEDETAYVVPADTDEDDRGGGQPGGLGEPGQPGIPDEGNDNPGEADGEPGPGGEPGDPGHVGDL